MFNFFEYLLQSFLTGIYELSKFFLVKFFTILVLFFMELVIFFLDISWEVAKELIQLANISQYLTPIFSILPNFLSDVLVRMGIFDFLSFVMTLRVTLYVSRFVPFL